MEASLTVHAVRQAWVDFYCTIEMKTNLPEECRVLLAICQTEHGTPFSDLQIMMPEV